MGRSSASRSRSSPSCSAAISARAPRPAAVGDSRAQRLRALYSRCRRCCFASAPERRSPTRGPGADRAVRGLRALAMVALTLATTHHPGGPGVDLKNAASARSSRRFRTPASWACRSSSRCSAETLRRAGDRHHPRRSVLTSSLCIAWRRCIAGAADDVPLRVALRRALRGALGNPLPWAIGAGALFSAAGWPTLCPMRQTRVVRMLADAATPVALFLIGAVLWRAGQHAHADPACAVRASGLGKVVRHPLCGAECGRARPCGRRGHPAPSDSAALVARRGTAERGNVSLARRATRRPTMAASHASS